MSLYDKLKGVFLGDNCDERDGLCVGLQSIGIPAQMAGRGRPEEKITFGTGRSCGVIDIVGSSICWVNIKESDGDGGSTWNIEYGYDPAQQRPDRPRT